MSDDHEAVPFWSTAAEQLLAQLRSSAEGLTTAEALARKQPTLRESGHRWRSLKLLLRQFESPLVLILVAGALLSLILRE